MPSHWADWWIFSTIPTLVPADLPATFFRATVPPPFPPCRACSTSLLRTEDQSERMTLFDHIKRIGQVKDIDAFEEMFLRANG